MSKAFALLEELFGGCVNQLTSNVIRAWRVQAFVIGMHGTLVVKPLLGMQFHVGALEAGIAVVRWHCVKLDTLIKEIGGWPKNYYMGDHWIAESAHHRHKMPSCENYFDFRIGKKWRRFP